MGALRQGKYVSFIGKSSLTLLSTMWGHRVALPAPIGEQGRLAVPHDVLLLIRTPVLHCGGTGHGAIPNSCLSQPIDTEQFNEIYVK